MGETDDTAETVVRTFTDRVNSGDYDALADLFASDYHTHHDNDDDHAESVGEICSQERDRAAAFAEKHEELTDVLVDADWDGPGRKLETWYDVTGTHTGEFLGLPPTDNDVRFHLVRNFIVVDGAITRYRVIYTLGFLLDLGLHWEALTDEVDMERYLETPAVAGSAKVD